MSRDYIATTKQVLATLQAYYTKNADRLSLTRNETRGELFKTVIRSITHHAAQLKPGDAVVENRNHNLNLLSKINTELQKAISDNNAIDDNAKLSEEALMQAQVLILTAISVEAVTLFRQVTLDEAELGKARQFMNDYHNPQDPVGFVEAAIRENRLHDIQPKEIYERIEKKLAAGNSTVSRDVRNAFHHDLKLETQNLGLPVNVAVLRLIADSPLVNRYETLTKSNQRNLRKMIKDIGEILSISNHTKQGALQDIEQLFGVINEQALLKFLKLLAGKKALVLTDKVVPSESIADKSFSPQKYVMHVLTALNQAVTSGVPLRSDDDSFYSLDTFRRQIPATRVTQSAAAAEPVNITQLSECIDAANIKLYINMKRAHAISEVIEAITFHSQELLSQTHETGEVGRAAQLKVMSDDLKAQFTLLQELTQVNKSFEVEINHLIAELIHDNQMLYASLSETDNHKIRVAVEQLMESYLRWSEQCVASQERVSAALNDIHRDLSFNPAEGLVAIAGLAGAAAEAQRVQGLMQAVRNEVVKVRETISRIAPPVHSKNTTADMHHDAAAASVDPQVITMAFAVEFSNQLQQGHQDMSSAAQLIGTLREKGLFTRRVQYKLLRQKNIDTLLHLQNFLNNAGIKVNEKQLCKLWDSLHSVPEFDLLKSLHSRLNLDAETLMKIFNNFSSSLTNDLTMLDDMFSSNDSLSNKVFLQLVDAAKHNADVINAIYDVYVAVRDYQSEMLGDFFDPHNIKILIDRTEDAESDFIYELVLRLKHAVPTDTPFKDSETWVSVLNRTNQYVSLELSYLNAIADWKKAKSVTFFDDYSAIMLGAFPLPVYVGAHQTNELPIQSRRDNQPTIHNISMATRSKTAALLTPHAITDFAQLDQKTRDRLSSQVNLNLEEKFLLQLMQMAFKSGGTLIQDADNNPSFVGWLSKDAVNSSQAQFMDYYVYLTMKNLQQEARELTQWIDKHKTLHQLSKRTSEQDSQLSELTTLIAEKKARLTACAAENYNTAFAGAEHPVSLAAANATVFGGHHPASNADLQTLSLNAGS